VKESKASSKQELRDSKYSTEHLKKITMHQQVRSSSQQDVLLISSSMIPGIIWAVDRRPPPENKACALLVWLATIDTGIGQEKLTNLINELVKPNSIMGHFVYDGKLHSLLANCQKAEADSSALQFYHMVNLVLLALHLN
jgi:hypothetical protein